VLYFGYFSGRIVCATFFLQSDAFKLADILSNYFARLYKGYAFILQIGLPFFLKNKMTRSKEYISRFFSFATVIYAQLQLFCFQRRHLCFNTKHMFCKDLSFLAFLTSNL
jgi:peptidoglycan biosynthesis protein MviN/MurJ (putative lipid II flippase)